MSAISRENDTRAFYYFDDLGNFFKGVAGLFTGGVMVVGFGAATLGTVYLALDAIRASIDGEYEPVFDLFADNPWLIPIFFLGAFFVGSTGARGLDALDRR